MPSEPRIERATAADAAAILQLQRLAYQSEAQLYDDWTLPPLQAEFSTSAILKAELDGVLVGAVRGKAAAARCAIGRLVVQPELQGRGIGRALMTRIETEFPTVRRFELFTGSRSTRNIGLYRSLGYRQCRSQAISDKLTLVWMEKCLASA